jgi:hypothetical protein
MCSTPVQRINQIEKAIDDLSVQALAAYASADRSHADDLVGVIDTDQVIIRLAQLWELLAELDPEIARRLPRYRA